MSANNAIVNGSGENNSASSFQWLLYLILAIGCGVLIFMMVAGATEIFGITIDRTNIIDAYVFSDTNFPQFANAGWWVIFAFFVLVAGFVETVIKTSNIEKTNISVTADGVSGKFVSNRFHFGAYRAKEFAFPNSEIDNVRTNKNFIELIADSKTYRIYVKNVEEIKAAIKI